MHDTSFVPRSALSAERDAADLRLNKALAAARSSIAEDQALLEQEIERIEAERQAPDVPQVIEMFCKILGKPKLNAKQLQLVAQVLGEPISDGRRVYPLVSEADSKQAEQNTRICVLDMFRNLWIQLLHAKEHSLPSPHYRDSPGSAGAEYPQEAHRGYYLSALDPAV